VPVERALLADFGDTVNDGSMVNVRLCASVKNNAYLNVFGYVET